MPNIDQTTRNPLAPPASLGETGTDLWLSIQSERAQWDRHAMTLALVAASRRAGADMSSAA